MFSGIADAQQNSGFLGESCSKLQDAQSPSGAQGLKPYQVIPIAFVFAMARKGGGSASREASLSVEFEARDAQTNHLVAAGMRQGTEALENPTDKVTLRVVKPVIDGWAKDARMFFQPKPKQ